MSIILSLSDGSNHNVCQYCDFNTKSKCPTCTNLGFEGFSLAEHDKQIRAEVIEKVEKEIKNWQCDIHDNEYDADKFDFVFERVYEILVEVKEQTK